MTDVASPISDTANESADDERRARSLALEKAYVHDVYDQIADHFTHSKHKPWPKIKQFLLDLEPGSLVADVGCGNGRYLNINPLICIVGSDRCHRLVQYAKNRSFRYRSVNNTNELAVADNLNLPFREDAFDAVLSVAVVHHFSTTERRVQALRELARVLRIGGKVIISVWAKEQRHRKFESQDVLVPWHRPVKTSSEDCGSSADFDLHSATTSDDDLLAYHAHTHNTSDSGDSTALRHNGIFSRENSRRKGYQNENVTKPPRRRSGLPCQSSSQSSSDLSSPNETCYSFVRRALKRLSSGSSSGPGSYGSLASLQCYRNCKKPWLVAYNSFDSDIPARPRPLKVTKSENGFSRDCSMESDEIDSLPIELRDLDDISEHKTFTSMTTKLSQSMQPIKSKSLGDILSLLHMIIRPKLSSSSASSDSGSSGSWSLSSLRRMKYLNNGIVKSRSSFGLLSRIENDLPKQEIKPALKDDNVGDKSDDIMHSFTETAEDENDHCNVVSDTNDQINSNLITNCTKENPKQTDVSAEDDNVTVTDLQTLNSNGSHTDEIPAENVRETNATLDVEGFNKKNLRISEERMKLNRIIFAERCSKLSEAKIFEYFVGQLSQFRSMPNLKLRSSSQAVKKQSSLDEQVLLDSTQDAAWQNRTWEYDPSHVSCQLKHDRNDRYNRDCAADNSTQRTVDDACSQFLNCRRNGDKKPMSRDDTALLSSSIHSRSHLWAVAGRAAFAGCQRPVGGLSPRLSTGSSSQQSDTSFDSEDSIVSVIAARPVLVEENGNRKEPCNIIPATPPDRSEDNSYLQTPSDCPSLDLGDGSKLTRQNSLMDDYLPSDTTVIPNNQDLGIGNDPLCQENLIQTNFDTHHVSSEDGRSTNNGCQVDRKPDSVHVSAKNNFENIKERRHGLKCNQHVIDECGKTSQTDVEDRHVVDAKSNVSDVILRRKEDIENDQNDEELLCRVDNCVDIEHLSKELIQICESADEEKIGEKCILETKSNGSSYQAIINNMDLSEKQVKTGNPKFESIQQSLDWSCDSIDEDKFGQLEFLHSNVQSLDFGSLKNEEFISNNSAHSREETSHHNDSLKNNQSPTVLEESCQNSSNHLSWKNDVGCDRLADVAPSCNNCQRETHEVVNINEQNQTREIVINESSGKQCSEEKRSETNQGSHKDTFECDNNVNKRESSVNSSRCYVPDVDDSEKGQDNDGSESDTKRQNTTEADDDDDDSSRKDSFDASEGGEDFTFHRYYHVFREGELDQLIEKYVDNLHIISSYYDHANWCIIAEKVQVWTI